LITDILAQPAPLPAKGATSKPADPAGPNAPGQAVFAPDEKAGDAVLPAPPSEEEAVAAELAFAPPAVPASPGTAAIRAELGLAPAEDPVPGETLPDDPATALPVPLTLPVEVTEVATLAGSEPVDLPAAPQPAKSITDAPAVPDADAGQPSEAPLADGPTAEGAELSFALQTETGSADEVSSIPARPGPSPTPAAAPKPGAGSGPEARTTPSAEPLPEPVPETLADLPPISEASPPDRGENNRPVSPLPPRAEPSALQRNLLDRLSEVSLEEGRSRFLLRPRGLGTVEIDLTRLMDGRMQVVLRLENPMVLEGLRAEADQLGAWLEERGFDLGGEAPEFAAWEAAEPSASPGEEPGADAVPAGPDPDAGAVLSADGRLNLLT